MSRVTVSVSGDLLCAGMLRHVMAESGFRLIPWDVAVRCAKRMLSGSHMYFRDEGLVDVTVNSDVVDASGHILLGSGPMADGLVLANPSEGHIRACDGVTADDLADFINSACEGDRVLSRILDGSCWEVELLRGVLRAALGAREVDAMDVPAGRPLVLVDFDDCVNVSSFDSRTHVYGPLSKDDAYTVDMERRISFPRETVGMKGPLGIRIPDGVTIRWSSELASDMSSLARETGATFAWLSSWMECSKVAEEAIWPNGDSPFSGYVDWLPRGMSDDGRHGKALRVSELTGHSGDGRNESGDGSPCINVPCLVVIDDKGISGAYGNHDGFDLFATAAGRFVNELTVSPDRHCGISRSNWRHVVAFVRKYARHGVWRPATPR